MPFGALLKAGAKAFIKKKALRSETDPSRIKEEEFEKFLRAGKEKKAKTQSKQLKPTPSMRDRKSK